MFKKTAATYKMPIEALHVPKNKNWDLLNTSNIKVAAIDKNTVDLGGFNLKAEIDKNPDHLFVKVFAIKANEVNDNGDCFSEEELKKAAHTFIGVPVFVNHQNDNIENARGKVVHAWYDDSAKGIYCINMVDRATYPKLARGIEERYVNGCFPPDAPVLMSDGTEKPICDIEEGDYVISGKGNICKVLGKRQRGYDYPLYSIDIEGIKNPLVCTSHHNIFVYRLPKDCACGCGMALSKCEDKRITEKNFNKIFRQGHNPRGIKFKHEYIQKIRACDIEEGDFLIEPKFLKESFDEITEDEAFLIGLFIAEGSFEKRNGVRHSVIFNFSHKELETLAFRCYELLEKVFSNNENKPTTNYYPGASQTRVCLYGKSVADWFYKYCGEYSDQKKMHKDLLSLNKNKTAALLAGYMEGDGYNVKDKVYGCATVSKDLASQLRLLFAKIGIRTRFRKKEVKTGYKAKAGGGYTQAYEIQFGLTTCGVLRDKLIYKKAKEECHNQAKFHNLDDITIRKIKSIKEVEYDGIVYDIEVEGDHSYCVNHLSVSNTSMGAQVGFSLCSICHNKANTATDFCTHIKSGKNRKVSGKYECKYHDSPCKPEDECPLDKKKKGETHEMVHKEAKVFEWNYDIKFIEDSFVVNPACRDCFVCEIFNADKVKELFSSRIEGLKKTAGLIQQKIDSIDSSEEKSSLVKVAGQAEIAALNQAMNLMEHVARSMMAQKQQIQLSYASDLIELIAKLQEESDELIQMGYAQLPSPPEHEIALGSTLAAVNSTPTATQVQPSVSSQPAAAQPSTYNSQNYKSPVGVSSDLGDIGTVTRPTFTGANSEFKKDLIKESQYTDDKFDILLSSMNKTLDILAKRSILMYNLDNAFARFSNGNYEVIITKSADNEVHVAKIKNDKLISLSSVEEFDDSIKKLIQENPQEAAKIIISSYEQHSGENMSNTKIAASDKSQQEVITQKQLDNAGPLHPRDDSPDVITQKQLNGGGKVVNNTTSEDNQQQKDNYPDIITESQLASMKSDALSRWTEWPDVITEAQWTEMSRRVAGDLPSDYTDQITQAQLTSLRKAHKWVDPQTITQDQLNSQKKASPEGLSESERVAAAKGLLKAATDAVSDAIANYGLTPENVKSAINTITASSHSTLKAGYLTLINAAPHKVAERQVEKSRRNYFSRTAGLNSKVSSVDGLLGAMADNIGYTSAEDFIDAIKFIGSDKNAFASAESIALRKISSFDAKDSVVLDKNETFKKAFMEMERPEDGLYKICGTISEDLNGADPANRSQFMKSLIAFAKNHIHVPFIVANVDVDADHGVFEMECKENDSCSEEEKKAFSLAVNSQFKVAGDSDMTFASKDHNEKEENDDVEYYEEGDYELDLDKEEDKKTASKLDLLKKEAQMMGGQLGGGLGGGGAGGLQGGTGAMGAADASGAAPVESLSQNPTEEGSDSDMTSLDEDSDLKPKPPGTTCPVCGSSDVDVVDGKSKCGNCGADWTNKVMIEITNYPGVTDSGKKDKDMDDKEGEGFALPDSKETASIPVAAMTRINNNMLKIAKEQWAEKGQKWSLGSVSPYTGSLDTINLSSNEFLCLDTGRKYQVNIVGAKKGDKKAVFAQWNYLAIPSEEDCEVCRRKSASFDQALNSVGHSPESFYRLNFEEKGKAILSMKSNGSLTKTASKEDSSLLISLRKVASYGDKFPIEACREKIARRFGENTPALSGPCEGKNLADCVCKKLSQAGIYSNNIALKVASVWAAEDEMVECVEDYVRNRFSMKQACVICDQIKAKYAQFDDVLTDELASMNDDDHHDGNDHDDDSSADLEHSDDDFDGVDPFDNSEDMSEDMHSKETGLESDSLSDSSEEGSENAVDMNDTESDEAEEPMHMEESDNESGVTTVEIPLSTLEELDAAIDRAKGEDPSVEKHHQVDMKGEAVLELPSETVDSLDMLADSVLDTAVEVSDKVGDAIDSVEEKLDDSKDENNVDNDPVKLLEDPAIKDVDETSDSEEEMEINEDESSKLDENNKNEEEFLDDNDNTSDMENEMNNNDMDSDKDQALKEAETLSNNLRKGRISSIGEVTLDLSGVRSVLSKQNKIAGELKVSPAQDDKDIGKYQDGKTLGNEPKFDAKQPSIPSGKDSLMGGEKDAGLEPVKSKPSIEFGGAEMGKEKEQGYTSEKQDNISGGQLGSGSSKAASTKEKMNKLATAVSSKLKKEAGEVVVKRVQDDKDIGKYQDGKTLGNEPKFDAKNPSVPSGKDSLMGGEKDAGLEPVKNKPVVETGKSEMGQEKELGYTAEKTNEISGGTSGQGKSRSSEDKKETVATSGSEDSLARKEAATRIAGKKLKANMISIDKLSAEIEKLARYQVSDLNDLENALFTAKKGLDTVAKGTEKALVVSEKANQRKAGEELQTALQSLFTLQKKNTEAESDANFNIKKTNHRI